jgi:hypothetical protein
MYTSQDSCHSKNVEAKIDANQEKMIAKTYVSVREMKAEI